MSIIRKNILSLETIILTSNLIVEVEFIESYEECVSIPSEGSDLPIADFIKRGLIFKIKRVLKNTTENTPPEIIQVPHENWRRSLTQHKEHHANGPSKSFTINTYETSVPSMKDAEILFLSRFQDTFNLISKNSFESLQAIKVIEGYISELL